MDSLPILEARRVMNTFRTEQVTKISELSRNGLKVLQGFESLVEEGEGFLKFSIFDVCEMDEEIFMLKRSIKKLIVRETG